MVPLALTPKPQTLNPKPYENPDAASFVVANLALAARSVPLRRQPGTCPAHRRKKLAAAAEPKQHKGLGRFTV